MFLKKNAIQLSIGLITLLGFTTEVFSTSINDDWKATTPGSDLNEHSNWGLDSVPTSLQNAIFNNTTVNIDTNPYTSGDIDVLTFTLNQTVSPSTSLFTFLFQDYSLTLEGAGVVGTNTDATFNIQNTGRSGFTQLSFDSPTGSSAGAATYHVSNTQTINSLAIMDQVKAGNSSGALSALDNATFNISNTGSSSGNNSSALTIANANTQFKCSYNFNAADDLTLSVTNTGSSNNTGNANSIGLVYNQMTTGFEFSANDNAQITIINSGTNTGTSDDSYIGTVYGNQFLCDDSLVTNNGLVLNISNTGTDKSTAGSSNQTGVLGQDGNGNQLEVGRLLSVGDSAEITMTNSGSNLGQGSENTVGVLLGNGCQLYVGSAFYAGDDLNLNVTNSGKDSSLGVGLNEVGYANGSQVVVTDIFTIEDNAKITISNSGANQGKNGITNSNSVGYVNGDQFHGGNNFQAGDGLNLSVTNSGEDTSLGGGSNSIGLVDGAQINVSGSFSTGKNAQMTIANNGLANNDLIIFNQSEGESTNHIGVIANGGQLEIPLFSADDGLSLNVTNSGTNNSFNSTNSYIGESFFQIGCFDFSVGKTAEITVSNTGLNTGSSSSNSIASTQSNGPINGWQFGALVLTANDDLDLTITNQATDSTKGGSNNATGSLGFQFATGIVDLKNNASLNISNQATNTSNNTNTNFIGSFGDIFAGQAFFLDIFNAGNDLTIDISNTSYDESISDDSSVGSIYGQYASQFGGVSGFSALDRASISISNDATGNGYTYANDIGVLSSQYSAQFYLENTLTAGKDFKLDITNHATYNGVGENNTIGSLINDTPVNTAEQTQSENAMVNKMQSLFTENTPTMSGVDYPAFALQFGIQGTFIATKDAHINITNSGTNEGYTFASYPSSSTPDASNRIGCIDSILAGQGYFQEAFNGGDYLHLNVSNTGLSDVSTYSVQDKVALIGQTNPALDSYAFQLACDYDFFVGASAEITVANLGTNTQSSYSNMIGVIYNDFAEQVDFQEFYAGNNLLLNISNTGIDQGYSGNNSIGCLFNNNLYPTCPSAIPGSQLTSSYFESTNGANITISNSGTSHNTDSTSSGGSNYIGVLESYTDQFYIRDQFMTLDHLNLVVTNTGIDNGSDLGYNLVGFVGAENLSGPAGNQLECDGSFYLGNYGKIQISNSGTNSGINTQATNNQVGVLGGYGDQFLIGNDFNAGNFLSLNISNSGIDSSAGIGSNFSGVLSNNGLGGNQLECDGSFNLGNDANISIANSGVNSGTNTNAFQNTVGVLGGYGDQFYVGNGFNSGNNLVLNISNSGVNTSASKGGNLIGVLNSSEGLGNTQLECYNGFITGNTAKITIANSGLNTCTNSHAGGDEIGFIYNYQALVDTFQAGDDLTFHVSNVGINNSAGFTGYFGYVDYPQMLCTNEFIVGNNAEIVFTNSGTNSGSGDYNYVGIIYGDQFRVGSSTSPTSFSAGTELSLLAINSSTNSGNLNGEVGRVQGSQLNFVNGFEAKDGSIVTAINEGGTVDDSQIWFQNGFFIDGKAIFAAANTGFVGGYGILVNGDGNGGDVQIVLENSSLYVDTAPDVSLFTIGGLTGDITSTVQSLPVLAINTDVDVNATFAGSINNFPFTDSALIKLGRGVQVLSGANHYTGQTTVEQGTLILTGTGSIAGNVTVTSLDGMNGLLKGTGIIEGNLVIQNGGIVMPGQSIGTLSINGNYSQDSSSTYVTQINGLGMSSLLDIEGMASLGGTLEVLSVDGTYATGVYYEILEADEGITPGTTFDRIVLSGPTFTSFLANPLLASKVIYSTNEAFLLLSTQFAENANSLNERRVGNAIDSIANPSGDEAVIVNALLSLDPDQIPDALAQIAGTQYTFLANEVQYSDRRFGRRIFDVIRNDLDPCFCKDPCKKFEGWISIEAGETFAKSTRDARGMHAPTIDASVGGHISLIDNMLLGAAISFDSSSMHFNEGGHSTLNTTQGAIYATWQDPDYYVFSDLVFGFSQSHFHRPIAFADIQRKAHTTPKFLHGVLYVESGMNFAFCDSLIQPFFAIDINYVDQMRFSEHSANSLDLHIHQRTTAQVHTYLGSHFHLNVTNWCSLNADIAWQHRFGPSGAKQNVNFTHFGNNFSIIGPGCSRDGIWGAVNATVTACDKLELYAEFAGEWWNRFDAYSGSLGASYRF